jgi:putative phosphoribosyl transferase
MLKLTRSDAGRRLALGLSSLVKDPPVVFALSAGGARVASEIARAFEAPLDVMVVKRLEVSGRSRSTFGAVADGATLILRDRVEQLGLPQDYVTAMAELAHREADGTAGAWRGGAPPVPVHERTAILVDDGSSEALLVAAAARGLRELGAARVIYAAPTATPALCDALSDVCDGRLLLFEPDAPGAAFVCDQDFSHTTRFDVRTMVRRSRPDLVAFAGP